MLFLMRSRLLFVLLVCVSFGAIGTQGQTTRDIREVQLDRTVVYTICPWFKDTCPANETSVKVSVVANNADGLSYYYVPSAGRIVGDGPSVVWDLTPEVAPGNYSLTVGVGKNGVITGQTVTRELKVSVCPVCDPPCFCPSLSIDGPSTVSAGDSLVITAISSEEKSIAYSWTLSGGTLVNGQGTKQIMVKSEGGKNPRDIHVRVEVSGPGWCADCPRILTKVIAVIGK